MNERVEAIFKELQRQTQEAQVRLANAMGEIAALKAEIAELKKPKEA